MKSILFISATLMVGACIYGFVDYKKTNRKKEFNSLYRNKVVATKSSLAPEQVARVQTIEKVNENAVPPEVSAKSTTGQVKEEKKAGTKRKVTRNKKLSIKKYSRAALVEEVVVPEKQK